MSQSFVFRSTQHTSLRSRSRRGWMDRYGPFVRRMDQGGHFLATQSCRRIPRAREDVLGCHPPLWNFGVYYFSSFRAMDVSNPGQFFWQRSSPTRVTRWEFQSNRLCTDIPAIPPGERWKGENSWGCVSSAPFAESQPPPCLGMSSTKQYLLCTWISAHFLWGASPQKPQAGPGAAMGAGTGRSP